MTELELRRFGEVAQQLKLTIPDSPEAADAEAEMLVGLTHGGNWGVAALVSARTEAQPGRRTDLAAHSARLTYREYAALGLRGFSDRETVAFYAKAWESRFPKPMTGETVALPDEAFPVRVAGAHVGANAGDNEWYTPPEYIAAARAVMGDIDLDPASTAEANEVVGASKFYTEADNGLRHVWGGRVWMNPPYARPLIDDFCAKLADAYAMGPVEQAVTLTNNATETGWFHALAEVGAAIAFPRQRVKFWHPRKESVPLQGQACFYLGENVQAFRDEFIQFGFTVLL